MLGEELSTLKVLKPWRPISSWKLRSLVSSHDSSIPTMSYSFIFNIAWRRSIIGISKYTFPSTLGSAVELCPEPLDSQPSMPQLPKHLFSQGFDHVAARDLAHCSVRESSVLNYSIGFLSNVVSRSSCHAHPGMFPTVIFLYRSTEYNTKLRFAQCIETPSVTLK